MILLGSVQRLELIKLIEDHVGRERRVQVVTKWQKEAQERYVSTSKERAEVLRSPSRLFTHPLVNLIMQAGRIGAKTQTRVGETTITLRGSARARHVDE